MKTIQIGKHSVTAPDRGELLAAIQLFITALAQWNLLLFSTGDLVASEQGWETLTKLLALFPIEDSGAICPIAEIGNDYERIERLFLSGVAPSPDSVAYTTKAGKTTVKLTDEVAKNFATPLLLELCGFQLWHILPEALEMAAGGKVTKRKKQVNG